MTSARRAILTGLAAAVGAHAGLAWQLRSGCADVGGRVEAGWVCHLPLGSMTALEMNAPFGQVVAVSVGIAAGILAWKVLGATSARRRA